MAAHSGRSDRNSGVIDWGVSRGGTGAAAVAGTDRGHRSEHNCDDICGRENDCGDMTCDIQSGAGNCEAGWWTESVDDPMIWNVTVEDDGFGNALLTFPEGETLVLRGISPARMQTERALTRAGIPCFTAGTIILTASGEAPVERLRPGDLVVTRDNGVRPLLWTGRRHLDRADLDRQPGLLPVRIDPGGWAEQRGLMVSPRHGLLARGIGRGGEELLVRAGDLVRLRGGKVRIARGLRGVTYVHLRFDAQQVIFSNGVATESFDPGRAGQQSLSQGPLPEILRLFPLLSAVPAEAAYGAPARPYGRTARLPDRADALQAEVR